MGRKLSPREKVLLVVLLAGVWIYGVYSLILSPQIRTYNRVQNELAEEKTRLSRARATAAALKTEMNRLKAAQENMARTGERFKIEMRDGTDIILLGLKSAAGNIDISGVEPGDIVTNKHSLAIPLKVTARGSYPDLLVFINELEEQALANLTEIRSLKVTAVGTPTSSAASSEGEYGTPGVVEVDIGLVIYSAKTPESRLQLEQLAGWLRGRENAFQPAGDVSPVQELSGHLKLPPPSDTPRDTDQETGLLQQTVSSDQGVTSQEP